MTTEQPTIEPGIEHTCGQRKFEGQMCPACAAEDAALEREIPDGWCPICGGNDGGHKPGCEDGSEVL